jgi:hypothetical protein
MATSPEIWIGRFLAVFAAAAISLLFAAVNPARSEAIEGEALTSVAEPPAEEAPPVESEEAPPVQAQAPAPAPTPTPPPAADISSAAAESPAAATGASVDSTAGQAVSNVVEEIDRTDTAAREVTTAVDGAIPSDEDRDPQPIVDEVLRREQAAKQLSHVGAPVHGSSGQGGSAAVETQAPGAGVVSGPGRDTSSSQTPGFLGSPADDQLAQKPLEAGNDLFLSYLTSPTGESLRLVAAGNPIDPAAASATTASSIHPSSGAAPSHPADRAPLDGPQPSPGSAGQATPGPAGSFFVPLAALLALLALVAPATLRRFREVPDLPAPALFVCALERPG